MRKLFLALALVCPVYAQIPSGGGIGGGGVSGPNPSNSSVAAVTSLAIDVTELKLTSVSPTQVSCKTGTGTGPYTPFTAFTFSTTGNPITSVTVSFANTANISCSVNATGSVGAPGATGPQGATGAQGPAATVGIGTVTTLSPGASATVTNAGTSGAAVLNFGIPRGDVGATGSTGAQGSQGPAGATGATGSQGPAGSAATIAVGTVTTGAAGTSASVTNAGTSSAAVFNFTIPRGDTGAAGSGNVNSASNYGTVGVSAFRDLNTGDLRFRKFASANNLLTIELSGDSDDYLRFTINPANFTNITYSGSLTRTGMSDGCATWASGVLGSTGTACGAGSGGEANTTADVGGGLSLRGTTPKTGVALNLRTLAATTPLSVSQSSDLITLAMPAAASGQAGYLSAADWATFNGKQAALGFTPENLANKGATNGYAALIGGRLPISQFPATLTGTTYYVDDTGGSDANNGTSTGTPWQTLTPVNAATLAPGDRVLFKSGGTWRGQLTVGYSGTETAPITYGSYASGASSKKPRITGADVLATTGWSLNTGSTYQKAVTTNPGDWVLEDGRAYKKQMSIANVDANPGSFYWASNVLYIRAFGSGNPGSDGKAREIAARGTIVGCNNKDNITISGLTLDVSTQFAISGDLCDGLTVEDTNLRMAGYGRWVWDDNGKTNRATFRRNEFYALSVGSYTHGDGDTYTDNTFSNVALGVEMRDNNNSHSQGFVFQRNTMTNMGLDYWGTNLATTNACILLDGDTNGDNADHHTVDISNNKFINTFGRCLDGWFSGRIAGNTFQGVYGSVGMAIEANGPGIVIEGNYIEDAAKYGVFINHDPIQPDKRAVISGNVFVNRTLAMESSIIVNSGMNATYMPVITGNRYIANLGFPHAFQFNGSGGIDYAAWITASAETGAAIFTQTVNALQVGNTAGGSISSQNVQAAINELAVEKQPTDTDLDALAALSSTGFLSRTGAATFTTRTHTGTSGKITVTNGDGVSGVPTYNIGADVADKTVANTYTAGAKQTFTPSGTTAGINVAPGSLPSSPANGDFTYNTSTNKFNFRENGAWVELGGGSAITFDNDTIIDSGGLRVVNTAKIVSQNSAIANQQHYCLSTGTSTAYLCSPVQCPTVSVTAGHYIDWVPNVNGAGGSTTMNYCSTSAIAIKKSDGTTNPGASDIVSGVRIRLDFDGSVWRMPAASASSGTPCTFDMFSPLPPYQFAQPSTQAVSASANVVKLNLVHVACSIPFTKMYIPVSQAGTAAARISVGYYDLSGAKVIDSGVLNASTTGVKTATVTGTLNPGSYYVAVASNETAVQMYGQAYGSTYPNLINPVGKVSVGSAANAYDSTGVGLPATLGTITGQPTYNVHSWFLSSN